ncbi:hypothetical protein EV182_004226, partial [Spiromyces aspiralis]
MCLSMFEDFFEVPKGETLEEKQDRYRKLEIGADPEFIKEHCGRYPVIKLDLKANLFDILDHLLECFPEIDEDVRKKVKKEEADKKAKMEADEKAEAAKRIRLLTKWKKSLHKKMKLMETDITSCIKVLMSLV